MTFSRHPTQFIAYTPLKYACHLPNYHHAKPVCSEVGTDRGSRNTAYNNTAPVIDLTIDDEDGEVDGKEEIVRAEPTRSGTYMFQRSPTLGIMPHEL